MPSYWLAPSIFCTVIQAASRVGNTYTKREERRSPAPLMTNAERFAIVTPYYKSINGPCWTKRWTHCWTFFDGDSRRTWSGVMANAAADALEFHVQERIAIRLGRANEEEFTPTTGFAVPTQSPRFTAIDFQAPWAAWRALRATT
jgi:hypothetical protein